MKAPTNKEISALAQAYLIAAISAVPLLAGVVAILDPVTLDQGPVEWGIVGFALSIYVVLSTLQFAIFIAMELAGNMRLPAMVSYILVITSANFSTSSLQDGVRSLLMFLVVSAALYLPARRFFLSRVRFASGGSHV
jgi:hypothetical protein